MENMDRIPERLRDVRQSSTQLIERYLRIVMETFFAIAAPKIIAASVQQKCPKHPPMKTAYIF